MSVREVAEKLGRPASTYASYEDKFKKPFLPLELVNALVPIFAEKGISKPEVMKLAGVDLVLAGDGQRGTSSTQGTKREPEHTENQEDLTTRTINIQQWPKDVRILGSASCGEDGLFEFNGDVQDFARRPPSIAGAPGVFALYIDGNSMFPWRKHGDLVYIHPGAPIRINDYVLVEMHPESEGGGRRAYIKSLVRRTADKLTLKQYNPEEEKILPMRRIKAIFRVLDWPELVGI